MDRPARKGEHPSTGGLSVAQHSCVPSFIYQTCGVQQAPEPRPAASCAMRRAERQYVPATDQAWATREAMLGHYHHRFRTLEEELWEIFTQPDFGTGQRAPLVRSAQGNLLWDCLSPLDPEAVAKGGQLGGLAAIAISHPLPGIWA